MGWGRDEGETHTWVAWPQIFHIPEEEIPSDLDADSPQPDEWDKYLLSYYPFAASEAASEGTCPEPETLLNPQVLVLNMCAQDDLNTDTRPWHAHRLETVWSCAIVPCAEACAATGLGTPSATARAGTRTASQG